MGKHTHIAERILLFIAFLVILNTFRYFIHSGNDADASDRVSGSALSQVLILAIYGPGIAILGFCMPKWLPKLVLASWPLFTLVGLAILSCTWSAEPLATLRRSLALVLTVLFALYVVSRFEFRDFLRILFLACLTYIVAGYMAVPLSGIGITPPGEVHAGSWRGFTGHKNEFGRIVGLIIAGTAVFWACGLRRWRLALTGLGLLALPLLYFSHSVTPIVSAAAAIAGGLTLRFLFQPRVGAYRLGLDVRILAVTISIIATVVVLTIGFDTLLELLGRDSTLTGRTKLWAYAITLGLDRPLFGAGYRAFWIDENTANFSSFFYWGNPTGQEGFNGPENSHSGYLDLFLELGFVGVALYAALQISALLRLGACLQHHPACGLALATSFCFLLSYSLAERSILQQTEGVWFLFMVLYLYAGRQLFFHAKTETASIGLFSPKTFQKPSLPRRI